MFKKILVYLDGAEPSECILPYAIAQAVKFGSKLVLLRVGSSVPLVVSSAGPDNLMVSPSLAMDIAARDELAEARSYLSRLSEELSKKGLEVDIAAIQGPIAGSIIKFIKDNAIDLVAMTARAHKGWKRLFLGSTVEEILRECIVPMLVINPQEARLASAI